MTVDPSVQQQQSTVSTTTVNGKTSGGLLTTANNETTTISSSLSIDLNKLSGTVPPQGAPFASSGGGDKEDSSLDAELLALAAQQMRSPTLSQPAKQEIKANPAKWSVSRLCNQENHWKCIENVVIEWIFQVTEVADFVKNLEGCADYAEDFAMQEIDGQALMLLKADHLMSAMSMKLGPALKICAKIDAMRGASAAENGSNNQQPNGNR